MRSRWLAALAVFGLMSATPVYAQDGVEAVASTEGASQEVAASAGAEFNRDLRTVEQEVNQLKERVFRSKATLQLLRELVIEGASLGSRVVLWHVNKMGPAYSTESIQYFLDGKNVYAKLDPTGALDDLREVKVHERQVPPGTHNLQVNMVLRGNGFGVFSYLRTYSFKVQSSYMFQVEDGRVTIVRVLLDEKGGMARRFVDRPNVSYEERGEALRAE